MKKIHKDLENSRWNNFSFYQQMANIGSEVERAINWKKKGNQQYSRLAFERMLELFDMTISDQKNKNRLKELCRLREILVDYLWGENIYQSKEIPTKNYFYAFNYQLKLK
ncbi:MAG: hypothetical protein WC557_01810 [Ignavibacteriaceae bacterium]